MSNFDFETLKQNILKDIDESKNRDIDKIYNALKKALSKFDKDTLLKNIVDLLRMVLKTKKQKCKLIVTDIVDSRNKLNDKEKEALRKEFLDISNIHRTLLEDIRALLDAL